MGKIFWNFVGKYSNLNLKITSSRYEIDMGLYETEKLVGAWEKKNNDAY